MKTKEIVAVLMVLLMIVSMGKSSTAFRCGRMAHNSSCPDGLCCNTSGYCGRTTEFCGKDHCQSQCILYDAPEQAQAHPSSGVEAIRTRKIPTDHKVAAAAAVVP